MEYLLSRIASSRRILAIIVWFQKTLHLSFPFLRFPVRVGRYKMYSQTLDRFAVLFLWKTGLLEQFEHTLIQKNCHPGMHVIDIGANIGFHTLHMSEAVGESGQVWAFEPDPSNFKTLQRNLAENGCKNVTAIQAAVSAKTESLTLYQSPVHHGDHRIYQHDAEAQSTVIVQAHALDTFLGASREIDLIKMDIQGAEGLALAGMSGLLERSPNLLILMEFWPMALRQTGCSPEDVLAGLASKGYQLFEIDEKKRALKRINDIGEFIHSIPGESYCNLLVSRNPQL